MSAYIAVGSLALFLAACGSGLVLFRKSHNNTRKFIAGCFKKVGINFES
jgi:hypothetical protein